MSRAHMLYDNKNLETLPVKVTNLHNGWNSNEIFKTTSGNGLIIEGNVLSRLRHLFVDKDNSKHRFVSLFVEVIKGAHRRFDVNSKEIEPDFGSERKVNTGYLSSSYKKVSREGEDLLKPSDVVQLLKVPSLDSIVKEKLETLKQKNIACVWCDEQKLRDIEIADGENVRIRTKGRGSLLESIVQVDSENRAKVNFTASEPIGESWTDKIMKNKDDKAVDSHLTDESKAVEDDEWDD